MSAFESRLTPLHPIRPICYIELVFNSSGKKYKTLNVDVIAKIVEDGKWVRKRAKGTTYVSHPNGKCFSTTVKPSDKTKP
ncbi:MAG: hypothetical protein ABI580_02145 [Burkholderiaceae bacterium]